MMRLTATFLVWLLIACGAAAEEPGDPQPAEIVERILELKRQIDELMARLPPEVREEVLRRLAQPPEPEAGADSATADAAADADSAGAELDAAPAAGALEPARAEAAPAAPEPALPRLRPRRAPCNTLAPFDEDADGRISAADRYWRYLYLWIDRNGDGQVQEREVESAYDRGVRQIEISLETFIRAKGNLGEVRLDDQVVFDLRGDGFSERSRGDDGILTVDATALQRGDGPRLLGSAGEVLEGFQPFRAGLALRTADRQTTALDCPRAD